MANNETAILKVALQLSTSNFRKQFNAAISRTSNALSKELTIQKKLLDIESKKSIVNTNRAKAQSAYTASLRQVALLEKSIQDKKRSALMLERQTGIEQEKPADGASDVQWKSAGYLDPKKVQEVQKLASQYNVLKDSLGRLAPATKAAKKRLYDYQDTITYTNREMKQLIRSTKTFNFDFLTLMFAGQMLQRTFGGALKSIVTDFNRITESQTAFGLATKKVNASFNYLKFAMGNALNNPLIISAMDWIIDKLEYLADVVDEHPNVAAAIGGIMLTIAGIGIAAQIKSAATQVGMMGTAIKKLIKYGGGSGATKTLDFLRGLSLVGTIAIGKITFDSSFEIATDEKTSLVERLINIGEWSLFGATFGFFLGGPAGAALGLQIGIGLGIVFNAIDFIVENDILKKASTKFQNAISAFKMGDYKGAWNFLASDIAPEGSWLDRFLTLDQDIDTMIGNIDGELGLLPTSVDESTKEMLRLYDDFGLGAQQSVSELVTASNKSFTTTSTDFAGRTADMKESFDKFINSVDTNLSKKRTLKIEVEYDGWKRNLANGYSVAD